MWDEEINRERMFSTLQPVIHLIATGQYDKLEQLTKGVTYSAEQIRKALENYPFKFVEPPHDFLPNQVTAEVFQIHRRIPTAWDIRLDLYTAEEGVSDMTVVLQLVESAEPLYAVEIEMILVM